MPNALPSHIGRFQVRNQLGQGGFGRVYCAFDPTVQRLVAIKVLTEASKDILSRFRNEAFVTGNLRHENIVTIYEFGEFEGKPFLAMEYLEGEDLQQIIAARKPLTLLQKCNIMLQVAEGLYCAHRNGVVHRDVKPANIMVMGDGRVKIMDFGIARLTSGREATRLTSQGSVIGTLLYMAPEQFSGGAVDALCDIFAYGVVFYELLSGRHPFEAADAHSLMYKIGFEDPPPLTDMAPECPKALQRAISRLMHKDRELRYQTLKELQLDIEPVRIELQQQHAANLLKQAQEFHARKQLTQAQSLVLEVLDLDPSNRLARSLWEDVQKQLQLRSLQPRIEALLKSADDQLAQRRFTEAVQTFDLALKLDRENGDLQGRRERAQALLEHSRQAAALLADARRDFEQRDLTSAHRLVTEALRHDPQNPEAGDALQMIERALERREREHRIQEAMARAETLLVMNSYDDAAEVLRGIGNAPEFPKVAELWATIQLEKARYEKRRKLQSEMAAATELLREQHYEQAVQNLDKLKAEFPASQEVARLWAHARKELDAELRSRALAGIANEVKALEDAADFNRALGVLDEALKTYPGEGILIRLLGGTLSAKADWERQRAIQATVAQCRQLRSQGKLAEAIQAVEAASREYGSQPELLEILQQLEQEWEQQKRAEAIRRASEQANSLLSQDRAQEAVQLIGQALEEYPGEPGLLDLLEKARERAQALERDRAVNAVLREAAAHAGNHEYNRALAVLARALQSWPGNVSLLERQRAVGADEKAWRREETIREVVRGARLHSAKGDFPEALNLVASTLNTLPGEPALLELKAQLETELAEHQRREAVERHAHEARRMLDSGQLDEAARLLQSALERYAGEPQLQELASDARQRIRARAKSIAVQSAMNEAQALLNVKQFDRAVEILENALRTYPGEPALLRDLESAQSAKRAWEREQAIAAVLRRVSQLAGERQFAEALQLIERALRQYPGERVLLDAQLQVENEWQEHKRREEIAHALATAESMIAEGRFEDAVPFLRASISRYPGEAAFEPLLGRAENALQQKKRAEAIEAARRDSEILSGQHKFSEALKVVELALAAWPGDATLIEHQALLRRREAEWKYQQAISDLVRQTDNLVRQGRFEDALALLQNALSNYPADPTLTELRQHLSAEWERQKREEEVGRVASQARLLLEQSRFEEALAGLRESLARYPGESVLETLAARADSELLARKRRAEATKQAEALIGESRFEEAIRFLQHTVAQFPGDEELSGMLARARELLEKRQGAEAIEKLVRDVRRLVSGRKYEDALLLLDRGLRNWPGETTLLREQESVRAEQAAWRREQALREQTRALGKLIREGRFAEALPAAEAALREHPGDRTLTGLREQIRRGAGLQEAARLLSDGRAGEALQLLENLAVDYPNDPELRKAMDRCREGLRDQERLQAIATITARVREMADRENFDGALSLIDDALLRWPRDSALTALRAGIEQQKAASERCRAFAAELAELQRRAAETAVVPDAPSMLAHAQSIVANCPELRNRGAPQVLAQLSDIVEAAAQLENRQYARVREIAAPHLAINAQHATFAQLAADAKRGERLAQIESVKLAAAREANLELRARILQEALERFHGEPSLETELRLTREKLNLAASLAREALALEAAGNLQAALEKWRGLGAVHKDHPDLNGAIARVEQALRKARADALAGCLSQIERQIEMGDLVAAAETVRRAKAEFPEDLQIAAAARRIDAIQKARERARKLVEQGQSACERRDFDTGRTRLREAFEVHNEADTRTLVLTSLIKFSRTALQKGDFHEAEILVREAASLDPGYKAPPDLVDAIAAAKKHQLVRGCLIRREQLESAGDLRGALNEIERLLADYPGEPELTAARQHLLELILEQREKLQSELRTIGAAAQSASESGQVEALQPRLDSIAQQTRPHPELHAQTEELQRILASRRRQLTRARFLAPFAKPRNWSLALAASLVAIAAVFGLPKLLRTHRPVSITFTSNSDGVTMRVGSLSCVSPCSLSLQPGTYTLTAAKPGYAPARRPLTVAPGGSNNRVPVELVPLPEVLVVNTNFESGSVFLDGRRAGELRDGQFQFVGIPTGQHTLRVNSGGAEFDAAWRSVAGKAPELNQKINARDVQATVVANVGPTANIACNCAIDSIKVDGAASAVPARSALATAALPDLKPGTHQIAAADRSIVVDVRPNPALTVFLSLDRNVGTLVVDANQDNARVYLNDRLYQRRTEHGLVRIPVAVGSYSVRVDKEGFRNAPAVSVDIRKGEEKRVTFALTPTPAVLEIAGALPQARVRVDGRTIGDTDAGGRLRSEVSPGDHTVELTKDGYTTAHFGIHVTAGATLRPEAAKLAMPGITKTPGPAQLEAQDWQRLSASNSIEELDAFIRKYPGGPHVATARARITQLRQQIQTDAQASAQDTQRRAEEAAWSAMDKTNKTALQDFLTRYPKSAHALEARNAISGIEKKEAADALEAQRQKQAADKQAEQALRSAADQDSINTALRSFESAYNQKDAGGLQAVWSAMPSNIARVIRDQFKMARTIKYELRPAGKAVITGDTASIDCIRTLDLVTRDGGHPPVVTERVRVTFRRSGSNWVIQDIARI